MPGSFRSREVRLANLARTALVLVILVARILAAFALRVLLALLLAGLLAGLLLVLLARLILLPRLIGILVRHAEYPHCWVNPALQDATAFRAYAPLIYFCGSRERVAGCIRVHVAQGTLHRDAMRAAALLT
jgi:hypothetical protein